MVQRKSILGALFLPLMVAADTAFVLNNDVSCGDALSLDLTSVDCDGDDVCAMGQKAVVQGTLTLNQDMPEELCITAKACFMGMSMFCKSFSAQTNFCEDLNVQPVGESESECPSAGEYTIDADFDLPEGDMNYGSGWWVTVYYTLADCSGEMSSISCTSSATAVSSDSSNAAYMVSMSIAGLALVAGAVWVRKRRMRAKIDLSKEEEQAGHFEMMRDSVRV